MSMRRSLSMAYSAQVVSFILTFSSSVVLARLLSPRDFGIFGMAAAVTTVISVFMTLGLARYIVREKSIDNDLLATLFTVNVLIALAYISSILLGSFISHAFFHAPELSRFLLVFAIFPLFSMMEFIPSALCNRDMRFGVIAATTVVRAAVTSGVTIALALSGFAYMSFAWAQVCAWMATSVIFNTIVWRPAVWRFRLAGARGIFQFGWQMVGVSGLNQLGSRLGEILLGSFLGYAPLGLYTRAANIPSNIYNNVFSVATNVIFSRLAQDFRESGTFYRVYYKFFRMLLALVWPIFVGIAVLANPLIKIVYGAKWEAAALPTTFLSLAFAVTAAAGLSAEILILRHETALQVRNEAMRTGVGLTLFGLGALISLPFVAAAKLAEALFTVSIYFAPLRRLIDGPRQMFVDVYREASLLTFAAVLPALLLMIFTHFSPDTRIIPIICSVALGVLVWAALLWRRNHPLATEFFGVINRLR